ncbi:globin [Novosphingobium umbonatum]|uniref:Globin n=1 Tax=Novosphingobium umbonatum TaxID=1908524 RepID=A0A3S2Y8V4_9SPHN|nr:globin [Novosphingobium umbonatum]RVU05001.1 globin [Novosphingobium umbonatum]
MEETATKPVTPFQRLGGAETFHAIADRFYALMDADPAYADLRAMHGEDLAPMKASLAGFLIGWSGGPRDWFGQGKCMMSLHRPLPIAANTAKQWADAMRRAIGDVAPSDTEMAQALAGVLEEIALSMVPLPEKA